MPRSGFRRGALRPPPAVSSRARGGSGRRSARRRDPDPGVDDDASVRPDDERVEVEFGDLGQARPPTVRSARRCRRRHGGPGAGCGAGRTGGAPAWKAPSISSASASVSGTSRWTRSADQVRRGTAEPDRDQRPEDRFAGHPDQQLGARRRHRLDQVSAQAWTEQRGELRRRAAHGVGGVEPQPHASGGGLVQHAVGHRLERDGTPRRGERGHGRRPARRRRRSRARGSPNASSTSCTCAGSNHPPSGRSARKRATTPPARTPSTPAIGRRVAARPRQPLRARGRLRERPGRGRRIGEHRDGPARAGHGQPGHVLRLAEPDRDDRGALPGRRGGDAGEGVGERGGNGDREDRIHVRVGTDGGHRGGEHAPGTPRRRCPPGWRWPRRAAAAGATAAASGRTAAARPGRGPRTRPPRARRPRPRWRRSRSVCPRAAAARTGSRPARSARRAGRRRAPRPGGTARRGSPAGWRWTRCARRRPAARPRSCPTGPSAPACARRAGARSGRTCAGCRTTPGAARRAGCARRRATTAACRCR